MEILFIVGLPTSGKTHLANQINEDNGSKYVIVDDPTNFNTQILPLIQEGKDIIVTDPHLCLEKNRVSAINKIKEINSEYKIDWIFFENNPYRCLSNMRYRNDKRKVENYIKQVSNSYDIPKNSTVLGVWDSTTS
jgi:hypothetical protein